MAVNQTPASAVKTPPAEAAKVAAPVAEQTFRIELTKIARYSYGGQLYLRGEHYVFNEAGARHMLGLRDPQELPVFRIAKPRKKLVAVEDTDAVVVTAPKPPRVDRVVFDLENFQAGKAPVPMGKVEIPDDDPDTAERLAALDAQGELDTAGAQTLA